MDSPLSKIDTEQKIGINIAPKNPGGKLPIDEEKEKEEALKRVADLQRDLKTVYARAPIEDSQKKDTAKDSDNPASSYNTTGKRKIIEIKNVDVVYNAGKNNEARALEGINIDIYAEEYVMFFGPSGCGKSTLLNIISGLEIPSTGVVLVDGQDLAKLSPNDLAKFHRRKTGMVFQSYNLIPTLNIIDNVVLPQMFERIKPSDRRKNGRVLLKKMGLEKFEYRLPQELSGGQQQRVSICRSLVNDPPIILADEAVGNLDSVSADNVLEILNVLNSEEKKTIISVTHNPEHLFYADRIFYIRDGKVLKIEINEKRKHVQKKSDPTLGMDLGKKGGDVEQNLDGKNSGESEKNLPGEIRKKRNELDLLLQAYPDLSSMQLHVMLAPFKAKMLVAYMINNFESEQISRMEKLITDRLLNRMSKQELLRLFDSPANEGGLGLYKNTAIKFSNIVEEVVEKSEYLKHEKNDLKEARYNEVKETIDVMRKSLLDEFAGELTLGQVNALNKGIEYRIFNKISKKEFQEYLDSPYEKGGVGLNRRSAYNLAKKMEIIMLMQFGS